MNKIIALIISSTISFTCLAISFNNVEELCNRRNNLFNNSLVENPRNWFSIEKRSKLRHLINLTLQRLRARHNIHDTCAEEVLTYLVEHAQTDGALRLLADELNLTSNAQRSILIDYKFLFIEGDKTFAEGDLDARQLLSFFRSLNYVLDIKSMRKGMYVLSVRNAGGIQSTGRTRNFTHGALHATRVARTFIVNGERIKDSIDNNMADHKDAALLTNIHEIGHGIFENGSRERNNPFSNWIDGQPGLYNQNVYSPEIRLMPAHNSKEEEDLFQTIINYYSDILETVPEGIERERVANTIDDSNARRHWDFRRIPFTRARMYGISSYAEDWATTWEAFFYDSEQMFQAALEREEIFEGFDGLRKRFTYLAEAFSTTQNKQQRVKKTVLFKIKNGLVHAYQAKLIYDHNFLHPIEVVLGSKLFREQ